MGGRILKNKPLVEAIFELRWKLQEQAPGVAVDPHYKVVIGRIYDRVKDEYPFHEQLPTATMPDEIAGYIVQHRFRKHKDKWPLIQIGPGIITLNDTEGYMWDDFKQRLYHIVDVLFEVYPEAEKNLEIKGTMLRYIDAIEFDYEKDDIFSFLRSNLNIQVNICESLFKETGVENSPLSLDLRFSFPVNNPKGAVNLRFVRGKRRDVDSLIWETQVQAIADHMPVTKDQIKKWVVEAHSLADSWFFKMIEGELIRRFE